MWFFEGSGNEESTSFEDLKNQTGNKTTNDSSHDESTAIKEFQFWGYVIIEFVIPLVVLSVLNTFLLRKVSYLFTASQKRIYPLIT